MSLPKMLALVDVKCDESLQELDNAWDLVDSGDDQVESHLQQRHGIQFFQRITEMGWLERVSDTLFYQTTVGLY